jgi:hypothetical protein
VRHEGDHLSVQESVQGNDQAKQDLLPESETQFFSSTADDVYSFETDGLGHATAMVLHTDGRDIPVKRID